jgi:hypothetical protein
MQRRTASRDLFSDTDLRNAAAAAYLDQRGREKKRRGHSRARSYSAFLPSRSSSEKRKSKNAYKKERKKGRKKAKERRKTRESLGPGAAPPSHPEMEAAMRSSEGEEESDVCLTLGAPGEDGPRYHPSRDAKVRALRRETYELEELVRSNIDSTLERGENMADLGHKVNELEVDAAFLRSQSKGMHRSLCWARCRLLLVFLAGLVVLALVIAALVIVGKCGFTLELGACMHPAGNASRSDGGANATAPSPHPAPNATAAPR